MTTGTIIVLVITRLLCSEILVQQYEAERQN